MPRASSHLGLAALEMAGMVPTRSQNEAPRPSGRGWAGTRSSTAPELLFCKPQPLLSSSFKVLGASVAADGV